MHTIIPKSKNGITQKITIWIHGTRGAAIFPTGISSTMRQVEESICTAPQGLHVCENINRKFHVRTIAQIISSANPHEFPLENFYSFGWSGELDPKVRSEAAHLLYEQLSQLVLNSVVKYASIPEITLITHSHGGNVALNLAQYAQEDNRFPINRLIVLACPVQQETASFVDSEIFKSVYAIHSHADAIQVLDPQGLHSIEQAIKEAWNTVSLKPLADSAKETGKIPLFSERHFASARVKHACVNWENKAPWTTKDLAVFGPLSNLVKKWAKWDTKPRGLLHIEFLLPSFLETLPKILGSIDIAHNGHQKDGDLQISLTIPAENNR